MGFDAQAVELRLTLEGREVCLTVADDGTGIPRSVWNGRAGGSGIRFMRERALLVGARLSISAREGGGTQVILRLPLDGLERSNRQE